MHFSANEKLKKAHSRLGLGLATVTVLELNELKAAEVASQSSAEPQAAPKANEMYFIDFKTCLC